ncbi:hypothetical protein C2S51_038812, partial [Perilla frutescens var. frutescens]
MASGNNGVEIEAADDNEFTAGRGLGGRQYRPVFAHDNDRAVLEMSSIDPSVRASSSASLNNSNDLKKVNVNSDGEDGSAPNHEGANGSHSESKLELFGFDSLVNILGLKSMTGDQLQAPPSPRDGDDATIHVERPKANNVKSGTMMGVFVPCLQNILGIIYYIRFSWIVGMAGIGQSLLLVAFCGSCTFLTTISLSAIATNGAMKGGGPYYLIGRALGPEVGVSIGLCFFLGNAIAGALYVLGAVETFLNAIPAAGIFRVFGGVKIINRVAPAFLVPVVFSLFCIFIGIFLARKDDPADGITGLSLDSFRDNWGSAYNTTNNAGVPDPNGKIYWDFNALVGLFFPAVTGIMAGSNRSASLKDTQRSIPIGTLAATVSTSALYLITVLFFGALATREKLLTDRLLTATVAWPIPAITYLGIILSTLGAALQSLTGAPRLLAAIANDDILPVLNYFKVADGSEPHAATLCSQLASPMEVSPLESLPSWAFICIVIMFLISWLFTVISLALATLIYYYVSLKGKAGDWGDGFKSAYFQLALRSLRSLGASQVHPKNWYPIPLIFCRPWGKLPETYLAILNLPILPITMGLGNLKPNIVVMRYPEIWRRENLTEIPATFVGIINDCIVANKAVVIVKGLDEWPNEYQRQYGTIDLYWIVRDGGLMLLLSPSSSRKKASRAARFRSSASQRRIQTQRNSRPTLRSSSTTFVCMRGAPLMADGKQVVVNEHQVEKFLYTTLKLNSTILRYSRMAAVVL